MSAKLYLCVCFVLLCEWICLFCVLRVNRVCQLSRETITNMFGCGFYFVDERYGVC